MQKKVLLFDDNITILNSLNKTLSKSGYYVEAYEDPCDFKGTYDSWDVVVTDVTMRVEDCWEVILKTKRQNPQTKVIVISGNSDKEDFFAIAKNLDADGFLSKPFSTKELIHKIEMI